MAIEQPKFTHGLNIGDRVQIMGDEKRVKQFQVDHGGWVDAMAGTIGQKGKIARLYQDGDVRVEVNGSSWTYNPACLRMLERATPTVEKSPSSNPYYQAPLKSTYSTPPAVKSYTKHEPPKPAPKPVPTPSGTPAAAAEKPSCSVCFEDFDGGEHRVIVFVPCGHTACSQCTGRMSQCHICRKNITTKMPVYI